MDKKKGLYGNIKNRFLARLIVFLMIITMVPYPSSAVFAAQGDDVTSVEESVDQTVDQENQQDLEKPSDQGGNQDNDQKLEEPADDQKQEDVKEDVKEDVEETPAVKQESSDDDPEEVVQPKAKKAGTKDGGTLTPKQQADIYYGPNGTARTIDVSFTETGNHSASNPAKAGEEIAYAVEIDIWPAAEYEYDGMNPTPMFSKWENITIELELPSQQLITGIRGEYVQSYSYDSNKGVWIITLKSNSRDATKSHNIEFDVNTRIDGNGALADGTVLKLPGSDPEIGAKITVSADFDLIVDEYGTTGTQLDPPISRYEFTEEEVTGPIPLTTPDNWIMTKSPYEEPDNYTLDKEHGTVTVHYDIKYGLNVNNIPAEDPSIYTREGRVPFASDIKLTDLPTLTNPRGGSLDALSITVTPAATGYVYKNGASADEGGKPKPITVTGSQISGEGLSLPYAVVGTNDHFVTTNAPAFSEYKVDVLYNYSDFMVYYYENKEQSNSVSKNDAKITYKLLGQNTTKETSDDGTTTIPAYIPPGLIEIDKYIVNYDGPQKSLYTATREFVSGPATYQIFNEDGTTLPDIYYKDSSGYHKISGNTLTIDPSVAASATNGNNGKISFYLNAGKYVIKETGSPTNTEVVLDDTPQTVEVTEGGSVVAEFRNKEKLGLARIHKQDDSNNHLAVPGAVFGLYYDEEHQRPVKKADGQTDVTVTTDSNGDATFERLIPGDYYIYEISAPSNDYIKSEAVEHVHVTANNTSITAITFTNQLNGAYIHLLKEYSTVAKPDVFNPVTTDNDKFKNAFLLQSSTDGEHWTSLSSYSIDNTGKSNVKVKLRDDDGKAIMYRFVETVPEGYFDMQGNAGDGSTVKVTSESVTPANGTDSIIMLNQKGGYIELTKKTVSVNASTGAYSAALAPGKKFELYRVLEGSTTAEYVGEATTESSGNNKGKLRFDGLVAKKDNKTCTYYVVEKTPLEDGYIWKTDGTTINIAAHGTVPAQNNVPALLVGSFNEDNNGVLTPTTYNIEQKIVLKINKRNKFTNGRLAGAEFDVYDGSTHTTIVSADNAAKTMKVSLGKTYTITETKVPAGYYKDATPNPVTIDTSGWKVDVDSNGNAVITKADGTVVNANDLTYDFLDTPYKKVRVEKKVKDHGQADEDAKAITNPVITFSVYQKVNGQFVPYEVNGQQVKITTSSTSAVDLPEGQYYLHEDIETLSANDRKKFVNPDQHPEEYAGKGETSNNKFYFGPFTVTKPASGSEADTKMSIGIINISNTGGLYVDKQVYNEKNQLLAPDNTGRNGFRMQVFVAGTDGKPSGDPVATLDTGDNTGYGAETGRATFIDLPVYDDQGNKIKYIVKEIYYGSQGNTFYTDNDIASNNAVELNLGTRVNAGEIVNHRYMSVDVVKKYYDAREYELTQLKYNLEGARIALYKKNSEGKYEYVTEGYTDSKGELAFKKLEYADDYVAIEVSVPDRPAYKYMVPADGIYLPTEQDGSCPLILDDISDYSKAVLNSSNEYSGEIDNLIPWTQIHITKKDKDNQTLLLDNADFILYKQVIDGVSDISQTDVALSFDPSADNLTVVGEYTSGTWIQDTDQDGEFQEGQFQTDILENANNIVYWLVETNPPPGYQIIPGENYVLFRRQGTLYTNNTNNGESTKVVDLIDNMINHHDVLDEEISGPGNGTENRAVIEFNKWMQDKDTAEKPREQLTREDFVRMPNATFELYAVNKETGAKLYLLDTITTGDENVLDPDNPQDHTTGYGVSRALDAWEIYDYLKDKFPDQLSNIMTYQSTKDPSDTEPYDSDGKRKKGTFWLNATLVEVSSSSLYDLDMHDHNLQIEFKTSGIHLLVGNSKYAVPEITEKNSDGSYKADLCDKNDAVRDSYEQNVPNSMAIVDYLAKNNSVALRHFGYDPDSVGYELLHEDLETARRDNPSQFEPKPVTFALQRYNPNSASANKWENWSPTENKKLTSGQGTFRVAGNNGYHFNNGLDPGEYRVVMTTPAEGYENFYPTNDVAFYFTVLATDRTQTFNTYSPAKPELTITKTDLRNNPITKEATFQLLSKNGSVEGSTYNSGNVKTVNGKAVFDKLPADTKFVLKEISAPEGYSSDYFVELFTKQYSSYADLVNYGNNGGYPVSYTTDKEENGKTGPDGSKLKEKIIVERDDYNEVFALRVKNADNVKVKLIKKDSQNPNVDPAKLKGAVFKVYYHALDLSSETFSVPDFSESDNKWISLGTMTTGTDGTITKDDLKPGVYYVVETKAPEGYEIVDEGQMIVMTGGLPITVPSSDKYTVNTDIGGTGTLTFKDKPMVKLIVDKTVETGDLDARDYSFEFTLKDDAGNNIASEHDTATGTVNSSGGIDKTNAEFGYLKKGKTYYLHETDQAGYQIKEVKFGGKTIQALTEGDFAGYYPIEILDSVEDDTVTVEVTNIVLEARVTVLKYDGEDGTKLTGAAFEVLKADKKTKVADATDNGDGSYTAVIPLESTQPATYFFHETQAPDDYSIDVPNAYIEISNLKPGDVKDYDYHGHEATDNVLCMPNYKGIKINILKYGGLPDASNQVLEGAKFQLYFRADESSGWSSWHEPETTDDEGKAEFLILPKYQYAIAEIGDVEGYIGIYNIYDKDSNALQTTTSDDNTLYILGKGGIDFSSGQVYGFTAYNIPFLELIVEKEDLSGTVSVPDVTFSVYEVPNGTKTELTEEEINDLIDDADVFIKNQKTGKPKFDDSTYNNKQFIRPGKTYLAVETKAIDSESEYDDYSIIKDDARVVSYKVFSVPEKNYEPSYKVTFENIKGDVTVGLEKDVDKETIDSLTTNEAELTYTLQPTTTNSYALDSYILNDSGLTPDPATATLADEWYNITKVIVGQGGRMDTLLKGADPDKKYKVLARVTFIGFDLDNEGNPVKYVQTPVDVTTAEVSVTPEGVPEGKNIKAFSVEYYSEELYDDTGYYLGQNFEAGATRAKATVFIQQKPADGTLKALKRITNNSDVILGYTPWSSTGEKLDPTSKQAKDDAVTSVEDAKAPRIAFEKTGPDQNTAIELGDEITYTLTVTNVTKEALDFTDPVIVDLLPRGMVLNQETDFVEIVHKPTSIKDDYTISTGYASDSQFVSIAFDGTVPKDDYIQIKLTAKVTDAVTNYGKNMKNFAFTTSKEVGVATSENAAGAVIQREDGQWALDLISVATGLYCDDTRANALKDELGELGTHGYLGATWENYWIADNTLTCVKAQYGPDDGGVYRSENVSLLFNDSEVEQRTMHYQLTINNLSNAKRTNLAVMDILPVVGDKRINNAQRLSRWDLYFDDIKSVTVNGETNSNYFVYYYTGDATVFDADLIRDTVNASKTGCPTGWSDTKPTDKKVTAFIVAFKYDPTEETEISTDSTVVLEGLNNVQIEYTAITDYRNDEELKKIVFTDAANDFNFGYSTFAPPTTADKAQPNAPLGSNVVKVTIAPPSVKVGGDIWIDADDNGWQDDGDQKWYLNYDIVKQLIGAIEGRDGDLAVQLNTSNLQHYSTTTKQTPGTIKKTGDDPNNYGIAHFEFDGLTAAKIRDGGTDYVNWNPKDDATGLVGSNPYTYHMALANSGSSFYKTINKVVPKRGSYIPDKDPSEGGIPKEDREDDNFVESTSKASVDYRTEQFFLHQTANIFDMTKDAGFNAPKVLELYKYGLVNKTKPVKDAVFEIYGPFDHDADDEDRVLSNETLVGTFTTDDEGKIVVGKKPRTDKYYLFFFKEYVIVEKDAGDGYSIDGAIAEGGDDTSIEKLDEGKWLLHAPAYDATTSVEEPYADVVTVKDPEKINVGVKKEWGGNGDDAAYGARPTEIKVKLYTDAACTVAATYENGTATEEKTLNAGNRWSATWTGLPRFKDSKPIKYYVKETLSNGETLKGYNATVVYSDIPTDPTVSGDQSATITNTPITKKLRVEKTWDDTDEVADLVTLVKFRVEQKTSSTDWTPTKRNGNEVILTLDRSANQKFVELEGLPVCDGNNEPLTYRGVEVSIRINGQTLDVNNGKVSWYDVEETHTAGQTLTARDLSEIKNTMATTKFDVEKSFTEDTFKLNEELKCITVKLQRKSSADTKWNDVTYPADAKSYDLKSSGGWKHNWTGLRKRDLLGNDYEYRAVEVSYTTKDNTVVDVDYNGTDYTEGTVGAYDYTSTTSGTADDGFKTYIDNKLIVGGLKVEKEWDYDDEGKVPESLTIDLKAYDADGNEITLNGVEPSTVLNEANNWADDTTWAVLPVYYIDGKKISYELTESSKAKFKAKYTITYNGTVIKEGDGDTFSVEIYRDETVETKFINSMLKTEFTVEKSFVDDTFNLNKDIKSITVKLQRKIEGGEWADAQAPVVGTIDLTKQGGWKHTWKELPMYDLDGEGYLYRAIEVSYTTNSGTVIDVVYDGNDYTEGSIGAYDYTSTTDGTVEDGFTTYIENRPKVGSLKVSKKWKNSKGKKMPESITIKLSAYAGGEEISLSGVAKSTKLNKANKWTDDTTWAVLPVYTADGEEITYDVTEVSKGKYDAEYTVYYNGEIIDEGEDDTASITVYAEETVKVKFTNTMDDVNTGDDTPLVPYLTMFLVSAAGLLTAFRRRRRRA